MRLETPSRIFLLFSLHRCVTGTNRRPCTVTHVQREPWKFSRMHVPPQTIEVFMTRTGRSLSLGLGTLINANRRNSPHDATGVGLTAHHETSLPFVVCVSCSSSHTQSNRTHTHHAHTRAQCHTELLVNFFAPPSALLTPHAKDWCGASVTPFRILATSKIRIDLPSAFCHLSH